MKKLEIGLISFLLAMTLSFCTPTKQELVKIKGQKLSKNTISSQSINTLQENEKTTQIKVTKKYNKDQKQKPIFRYSQLHIAVINEDESYIITLIQKGENVNTQDSNGNTPLHLAVLKNNPKIVKILLINGSKHNIRNREGKTPLDIAKELDLKDIKQILEKNNK